MLSAPPPAGPARAAGFRFASALLLALAAAAYLCFALPAAIYVGNHAEFGSPLLELLQPFMRVGLVAALALAVLGAILPARAFRRALVLGATLCLLAWLQGSVLVWNYGLFDGALIDWSRGWWRGVVDASIWIAALLLADARHDRLVRILPRAAILVCLLQCALAAGMLATAQSDVAPPRLGEDPVLSMGPFSRKGNVLQILADGMQTDVVADLLEEDKGRLARELDGFVMFEDNLGAFPYTHMSVPAMLSGHVYDNSQRQGPFLDQALGRDSIFAAARADGYDVEVGVPIGGLDEVYGHAHDIRLVDLPNSPPSSQLRGAHQESLLLGDLVLFRIVPHFAKRYVYNDLDWLLQSLFGSTEVPGRSFLASQYVLRQLAARETATGTRPDYKYLHLMLSHRPMVMNADCSQAGGVLTPDRANVRNQERCALRSLVALLARMRALGIYDDATIVIAGDHGTFIAPTSLAPGTSGARRARDRNIAPGNIGQARPVLLVKRPHASGSLRRSQAPTWVPDLPETIADAAGIPGVPVQASAFRLQEGSPRLRRFSSYDYQRTDWSAEYLGAIRELQVLGRDDDPASWATAAVLHPPGGKR